MRVLLLAVVALCACGPLMPLRMDGGSAGGSGGGSAGGLVVGGGFTTAGGNVGGGSVGGGSSGGGTASAGGAAGGAVTAGGSAGGSVDAGLGNFIWSNLAVQPSPTSFTSAMAVSSRAGEAWVALDNGKLYRSTGGVFNEVTGFVLSGINDLYVAPSGKVFAVTQGRSAAHCLAADCSVGANFTTVMIMAGTESLKYLCGSGERVMAVGTRDTSGIGTLYEFDPMAGQWTKVSNNLGISTPRGCVIGPAGEVYVVGDLGVIRYENGATTPEPVDLAGQAPATWTGIAMWISGGAITEAMLVGSGSGYRFARRNNTAQTWTSLTPNPLAGSAMYTVMALGPTEFLGAGSGTAASKFMMWSGTAWVPAMPAPPNTINTTRDSCVTDAREVFLVGGDGASAYSIIRGRR